MKLPEDLKNFKAIDWDWVWMISLASLFSVVAITFVIIFILGS